MPKQKNEDGVLIEDNGDIVFCDNELCEWEAMHEYPQPDKPDPLFLCASCNTAYELGKAAHETITIEVKGGVVVDVGGLAEGQCYELIDRDDN